jgi:hypothetical protein
VPVPSYFGNDYDLDLISSEETLSVLLSDGTIVLAVSDFLSERYNLFALDSNNFNIKATRQSTRNGEIVSITTYDDYIIIGTDSSIDFWELGNYTNPAVTPQGGTPSAASPTQVASPNTPSAGITAPPPVDPLGIGLGVSLSVAGAVGVFLLIYFLVIKKRMNQQKEKKGDAESGDGSSPYSVMPSKPDDAAIDEKMQIPYKQLKFVKEIGAGSFGKVYQGYVKVLSNGQVLIPTVNGRAPRWQSK